MQQIRSRTFAAWNLPQQIRSRTFAAWNFVQQIRPRTFAAWNFVQQIRPRTSAARNLAQQIRPRTFAAKFPPFLFTSRFSAQSNEARIMQMISECLQSTVCNGLDKGRVVMHNVRMSVANDYIEIAKSKTSAPWHKTLVLAVMAGAFIAFGGAVATIAASGATGMQSSLIKGAVFPLGLILVVVCGVELFTGNCLFALPLLSRDIKPSAAFKNLGIVYVGNLIGGALIAVLVVFAAGKGLADLFVGVDATKCGLNFGEAFLRGILCNMLVCLAVWSAVAAKTVGGKILAVYLPIFAFVVCGFEHSVANMYYLTAGLVAKAAFGSELSVSLGSGIVHCLIPSTLGNIIGGALIGVAFWAVNKNE